MNLYFKHLDRNSESTNKLLNKHFVKFARENFLRGGVLQNIWSKFEKLKQIPLFEELKNCIFFKKIIASAANNQALTHMVHKHIRCLL